MTPRTISRLVVAAGLYVLGLIVAGLLGVLAAGGGL